jgi:hypothetical protein
MAEDSKPPADLGVNHIEKRRIDSSCGVGGSNALQQPASAVECDG